MLNIKWIMKKSPWEETHIFIEQDNSQKSKNKYNSTLSNIKNLQEIFAFSDNS